MTQGDYQVIIILPKKSKMASGVARAFPGENEEENEKSLRKNK